MFPVSISPYLAGVAPLYLSIRHEEGERKVRIYLIHNKRTHQINSNVLGSLIK